MDIKEYIGKEVHVVIAIIHRTNDDDKLIVTENNKNFTDEEIRKYTEFQEKYFESVIYR